MCKNKQFRKLCLQKTTESSLNDSNQSATQESSGVQRNSRKLLCSSTLIMYWMHNSPVLSTRNEIFSDKEAGLRACFSKLDLYRCWTN